MSVVWRKSSRSNGAENSDCVEIALDGPAARVRDSKGRADATVAAPAWDAFLAMVKGEEQFRS
ncbi:DUF397 domain-containing protein [Lentzea flaviverrucosa]|uniref:DUF397 domain-containing protein n=1 Tax=Lentzea flaviverrucosa TaxID=200379 RepID=A0A1H9WQ04_9PSEU|nr:uncharacterized protein DUF397 [Lentzea flaviverrucosa]SES36026.1 protein of unknown function [Lentzea flaviverrucosa]